MSTPFDDLPQPDPLEPPRAFLDACEAQHIAFDTPDLERLGRFLALLLSATQRVNLTAIRDPAEAWIRHIFDALTLLPVLDDLPEHASIIDVGAGAGLPSIPLAIVCPGRRFTCLESTARKCAFLDLAIQRLAIDNASVIRDRAENLARDRAHREAYDAALARALAPIRTAAELTVPLVRRHGLVALVKGQKADQELEEARHALAELRAVHAGTLQTPTGRIVILTKHSATPRRYPRRPGEPKNNPL